MFVLKERSLQERGTVYTKTAPKEAWDAIIRWAKTHSEFQVHFTSWAGLAFYMEARYDRFKLAGSRMEFRDSKNFNNRMALELRDITGAEIGEDRDVDFMTARLDLKIKSFISITPF
jgi:hypothetical protein